MTGFDPARTLRRSLSRAPIGMNKRPGCAVDGGFPHWGAILRDKAK
jgi:hypothetical protein